MGSPVQGPSGAGRDPARGLVPGWSLAFSGLKPGVSGGGPGSCLLFRTGVPAGSRGGCSYLGSPVGAQASPPPCRGCSDTPCHRALAVREWPPGTLMGPPSPCGSVLQPGSSSVTSQSHHWEPSATRAKSRSTEGTSAGSMEPRMRDLQIKPEPLSEASGCLPLTPTPTATKATGARTARSRAGHPVPSPGPLPVSSLGVVGLTRKVC